MVHTLQEAANMLGVEQKTLRKWVKDTGIQTQPDDVDLRRRLLDDEQVEILRNRYRRSAHIHDDVATLVQAMQRQITELSAVRQQVAALTEVVTTLQSKITPQ